MNINDLIVLRYASICFYLSSHSLIVLVDVYNVVLLLDLTYKFNSYILKLFIIPLGLILMGLFESVGIDCILLLSLPSRTLELTKKSFFRSDDRKSWS